MTALAVAAATKSSTAGTLALVFLAVGGFLVGGTISLASRKRVAFAVVIGIFALVCFGVAYQYYRSYKAA